MTSTAEQSAGASKPDGSSTAPACDQCRSKKVKCDRLSPLCSNCRKSGSSCDFSSRSKRVNHSQQLVNDFTALAARLDSIDQSLSNLNQRVSVSERKTPVGSATPSVESNTEDVRVFYQPPDDLEPGQHDNDPTTEGAFRNLHQKFDDSGGERFYGSTSALSLFESCRKLLGDALSVEGIKRDYKLSSMLVENPTLKTQIFGYLEQFPFLRPLSEPDTTSDGRPVAEPPRSFLNSVIDIFLNEVNSIQPVFDETKLLRDIKEPSSSALSEAESLCFNNIILLALSLMSQSARRSRFGANAMNDDLIHHFINNSRRALDHLERYNEPRMINIQALTSLAMVAREYWNGHLFARLCRMACSVAKSMGLQRIPGDSITTYSPQDKERADILWTLYVMDKERAFMSGIPCEMYLFDCDVRLSERESGYSLSHYRVALIHMMSLWEEIHIALYSSRVGHERVSQIDNKVSRLNSRLTAWAYRHVELLNNSGSSGPWVPYLRQELKYVFHVAQILIHRCGSTDLSKQRRMANARAALGIIQEIHSAAPCLKGAALLRRCFRHYPMLPFLDLFGRYLADPELDGDEILEILRSTPVALDSIQDPNFTESYHSQLHAGLRWCVNIVDAVKSSFDQSSLSSSRPRSKTTGQTHPNAAKPSANRPFTASTTTAASNDSNAPPQPVPKTLRRPAPPLTEADNPPKKRNSQSNPVRSSIDDFISFASTSMPDLTSTSTADSSQIMSLFPRNFSNDFPTFNTEDQTALSPTGFGLSETDIQHGRESLAEVDPDSMLGNVFNPPVSGTGATSDDARPLQIFYNAGTLDNFMPRLGSMVEPWDMDISSFDNLGDSKT